MDYKSGEWWLSYKRGPNSKMYAIAKKSAGAIFSVFADVFTYSCTKQVDYRIIEPNLPHPAIFVFDLKCSLT